MKHLIDQDLAKWNRNIAFFLELGVVHNNSHFEIDTNSSNAVRLTDSLMDWRCHKEIVRLAIIERSMFLNTAIDKKIKK